MLTEQLNTVPAAADAADHASTTENQGHDFTSPSPEARKVNRAAPSPKERAEKAYTAALVILQRAQKEENGSGNKLLRWYGSVGQQCRAVLSYNIGTGEKRAAAVDALEARLKGDGIVSPDVSRYLKIAGLLDVAPECDKLSLNYVLSAKLLTLITLDKGASQKGEMDEATRAEYHATLLPLITSNTSAKDVGKRVSAMKKGAERFLTDEERTAKDTLMKRTKGAQAITRAVKEYGVESIARAMMGDPALAEMIRKLLK